MTSPSPAAAAGVLHILQLLPRIPAAYDITAGLHNITTTNINNNNNNNNNTASGGGGGPPIPTFTFPSLLQWTFSLLTPPPSGSDEEELKRWSSLIGIIVSIAGNVLISLALNIQKYAHVRLRREKRRRWVVGRKRRLREAKWRRALERVEGREGEEDDGDDGVRSGQMDGDEVPGQDRGVEEEEVVGLLVHDGEEYDEDGQHLHHHNHNRSHRHSLQQQQQRPKTSTSSIGEPADKMYLSSPWWWSGFILMLFGEFGNFLAYGFAPASIVSPLGVVALISNCMIAPLLLKEPFRGRDLGGVIVSIIGAVVVVSSSAPEEVKLGPDQIIDAISQPAFLIYFLITSVMILVLIPLSTTYGSKLILIDLGLVALFGGFTVLSTKGFSSLLSSSLYHIFTMPIAYVFAIVLVGTAVLQIKYINRALQRFDSTQVIPTQFVLFTLSVIIGSGILYRDFEKVGRERGGRFVVGCGFTFWGVYLITSGRVRKSGAGGQVGESEAEEEEIAIGGLRDGEVGVGGGGAGVGILDGEEAGYFNDSTGHLFVPGYHHHANGTPTVSVSPGSIYAQGNANSNSRQSYSSSHLGPGRVQGNTNTNNSSSSSPPTPSSSARSHHLLAAINTNLDILDDYYTESSPLLDQAHPRSRSTSPPPMNTATHHHHHHHHQYAQEEEAGYSNPSHHPHPSPHPPHTHAPHRPSISLIPGPLVRGFQLQAVVADHVGVPGGGGGGGGEPPSPSVPLQTRKVKRERERGAAAGEEDGGGGAPDGGVAGGEGSLGSFRHGHFDYSHTHTHTHTHSKRPAGGVKRPQTSSSVGVLGGGGSGGKARRWKESSSGDEDDHHGRGDEAGDEILASGGGGRRARSTSLQQQGGGEVQLDVIYGGGGGGGDGGGGGSAGGGSVGRRRKGSTSTSLGPRPSRAGM